MSTLSNQAKSTKIPFEGKFLMKFFNGKKLYFFFVTHYNQWQLKLPTKQGPALTKDQYTKKMLENGKKEVTGKTANPPSL